MILILPVIILMIIIGIVSFVSKPARRKGNYPYNGRVWKIFTGYLILLLICAAVDPMLSSKDSTAWKKVNAQSLEKETERLHSAALEGKIDQVDSQFKIRDWSFNYSGQKLNAMAQNNEYINRFLVVVERKMANDGQIDAAYYQTKVSMNDLDITKLLQPIDLKLAGNQLMVIPKKSQITFPEFSNVFPINQFTGKSTFSHGSSLYEGQSILYLKVPKNLEIITDEQSNLEIKYVKEK